MYIKLNLPCNKMYKHKIMWHLNQICDEYTSHTLYYHYLSQYMNSILIHTVKPQVFHHPVQSDKYVMWLMCHTVCDYSVSLTLLQNLEVTCIKSINNLIISILPMLSFHSDNLTASFHFAGLNFAHYQFGTVFLKIISGLSVLGFRVFKYS